MLPLHLFSKDPLAKLTNFSEGRKAHYSNYEALPEPAIKLESWKHTTLALFDMQQAPQIDVNFSPKTEISPEAKKAGVKFGTIREFESEEKSSIEKALLKMKAADKVEEMQAAFWTNGVFLRVPKGVDAGEVRADVHLDNGSAVQLNVIVLENDSKAKYFETLSSAPNSNAFLASRTVFLIGEGAELEYYSLQDLGASVHFVANKEFFLSAHSRVSTVQCEFGAKLSRVKMDEYFEGDGAQAGSNKSIYFGSGKQHIDLTTNSYHVAKNTESKVLVKGALKGKSSSVYRGLVKIYADATNTDSFLSDHNLHLNHGVVSNSVPSLEIDNNEVKCSHGATVSKLNPDTLFYLESRGLKKPEAEKLVVEGFYMEVADSIPNEALRAKVDEIVRRKLGEQ